MTAHYISFGRTPLFRTVVAALSASALCLAIAVFAASPASAQDATQDTAKPQPTTAPVPGSAADTDATKNIDAAKAQAGAQPAPNPNPASDAAKPNGDANAAPQPNAVAPSPNPNTGSDTAKPNGDVNAQPQPNAVAPGNANADTNATKNDHEPAPNVQVRVLPHELSPWGMFLSADVIVKVVMVGLAIASVITWTVWLAKSIELFGARRRAQKQLAILASEETLATSQAAFTGAKGAVAQMAAAAAGELERSAALSPEGIKERAATLIARIEARAGREMNRGTGILATIGATAPFIGLFGTVWGIMNSFIGISKTNTTNLAVVAPGIAEALLATAIGLVAAIPAVMIYNVFARSIATYRAALADAAAEIMRHLSRDLDRTAMEATEDEEEWRVMGGMRQSAE
jgi:biopolymer transport protein ExbB